MHACDDYVFIFFILHGDNVILYEGCAYIYCSLEITQLKIVYLNFIQV